MTIKISPQNPQGLFWVKMVYPIIALFLLILIIFPFKSFKDDIESNKPEEYSPTTPPRVRLMCINTISIVMFFMSINEFNFYQVLEPIGIDASKIPSDCSIAQYCGIVFLLFIAITFLVFYNFVVIRFEMVLSKGSVAATDIIIPPSVTMAAAAVVAGRAMPTTTMAPNTASMANYFSNHNYTTKNYGLFMTNNFPNAFELFLCVFLCVASISIYTGFLISRYFASGDKPMRFCLHPQDLSRYIDPYANPEPPAAPPATT